MSAADQTDLFAGDSPSPGWPAAVKPAHQPLAARMRPRRLDEVVGQSHLLKTGSLLPRLVAQNRFGSLLFYGPPGCGKTFLATALGHAAIRRRISVHFERCDRLLKRLRASRLDNSHDAELRKLLRVDLLILDDFALGGLNQADTDDLYEIVVERHRTASTIVTSNREPVEWLALMADPLLAQSAVDRLKSAAYELIVDGDSYRNRQKPTLTT